MKKLVCVVIPIYQPHPTKNEVKSLRQCSVILKNHDLFLLAPHGLDISEYLKINPNILIKYIDPKWQESLFNYNKLKLSLYFYKLFENYKYLLTYELDAFVFKDELIYWCNKDYDYIGAPWFEGYKAFNKSSKIVGVGNSGFSLRKISAIQHILHHYIYDLGEITASKKNRLNLVKFVLKKYLRKIKYRFTENSLIQKAYFMPEDFFFCREIPKYKHINFNIAPINDAIKFSFETNASLLFQMNNDSLPFGCHAWEKFEPDFWSKYID